MDVHHIKRARIFEENLDDVALSGADDNRVCGEFFLIPAGVAAYYPELTSFYGKIEWPGICRICEIQSCQPFFHIGFEACLSVRQDMVPESAHERKPREIIKAVYLPVRDLDVVQYDCQLIVRGSEAAIDYYVAVKPELLLPVLADVRMIPVDAIVRQDYFVHEAFSRFYGRLDIYSAVVHIVQPYAMPVYCSVLAELVREIDVDCAAPGCFYCRPRYLAVVCVHVQLRAVYFMPHGRRLQREDLTVCKRNISGSLTCVLIIGCAAGYEQDSCYGKKFYFHAFTESNIIFQFSELRTPEP